ncbi:MAG: FolC bifunctional protein [Candidatus Moranbacteria bacterium GW2011_GWD2_38_7]|nr:MAG: FolC bifunctional protein [Candidatus Moranbacteria bacterium GW2011_GWD2_38_7]
MAQFEEFLKTRIPTREALFMGDISLQRAKYFMKLLGDPQNKLKVIHIAGTSGKGSTAYLTSHILQSQGFKVGLSISPHIFDIRERMQINNDLPDKKIILKYFNQILPAIRKMENCKYGAPTFFEINVALAFYMFAKEKIDYAIMETGLGGTLDATNTVTSKNKICVITKIGLDHTEILGKTISKISSEKAGIIQKNNLVISNQQSVTGKNAIESRCEMQQSPIHSVKNRKNYKIISSTPQETIFDFIFQAAGDLGSGKQIKIKDIKLGLIGAHQAENCSLSLSCLAILSSRDKFKINEPSLRDALKNISIPGRMEIRKIGKQTLIIDGAHNPQKMETFTSNLANIYPQQKFTFLVAFKKGKDFEKMLKNIIPLADSILLTEFSTSTQDNHLSSTDNETISKFLKSHDFQNFSIIKNKQPDIKKNIWQSKKPVVITGSLYFIGSIYSWLKT